MIVLAQATAPDRPGFLDLSEGVSDNAVLDEFRVPFGDWMEQSTDWVFENLRWLLDAIKWPFSTLNSLLVNDVMGSISWVWIAVAFLVIGTLARNFKVGVFAAVALGVCGFLGQEYWQPTIETLGFVSVAVLVSVIIGIPLGVACGRIDAVWRVVRPVLDAMQVVHAFVYMLPFIAFFGIGNVGATIVTMAFAMPPLVRLTNLGIRQVPADVVEASRAYGAPEWRVLVDVQLPLARTAIMTGVNQTLLLAVSMLGIAAIMGAQGLGGLLFGAINRQSVADAAPAGLAFYLVAVVFDRISQPEGAESGGLLRRIRRAWAHRRDPEALLSAAGGKQPAAGDRADATRSNLALLTGAEFRSMVAAALGGLIAACSILLTWTSGAGSLSAHGRLSDMDLPGESFNGLVASGGSWFGVLVALLGLLVLASALATQISPGRGPRWLSPDGAVLFSLGALVLAASYLLASPPELADGLSRGAGPWVALAGALIASAGSVAWICSAPHAPLRPLPSNVRWGRVAGAGFAVVVLAVAAISVWSFDQRSDVMITSELQAQLSDLEDRAAADPDNADSIRAQTVNLLKNSAQERRTIIDGVSGDGSRLGVWVLLAGLAGLAAALPAAGVFSRNERWQWIWSSISSGMGIGVAAVGFGWIFTHVRSADQYSVEEFVGGAGSLLNLPPHAEAVWTVRRHYVSGVGSMLAFAGGMVLVAAAAAVLKEFRRTEVYADEVEVTT